MIFVDTGAFIGRYVRQDQRHREALPLWEKIEKNADIYFTSNYVLDELLTYLGRHVNHRFAAERGRALYFTKRITILRPTQDDEMKALTLFEKFADQKVGFTDCVSFTLMRKQRIETVFSFDRHFTLAGFDLFK
jgi:predicted nucleic acid-binding protein